MDKNRENYVWIVFYQLKTPQQDWYQRFVNWLENDTNPYAHVAICFFDENNQSYTYDINVRNNAIFESEGKQFLNARYNEPTTIRLKITQRDWQRARNWLLDEMDKPHYYDWIYLLHMCCSRFCYGGLHRLCLWDNDASYSCSKLVAKALLAMPDTQFIPTNIRANDISPHRLYKILEPQGLKVTPCNIRMEV